MERNRELSSQKVIETAISLSSSSLLPKLNTCFSATAKDMKLLEAITPENTSKNTESHSMISNKSKRDFPFVFLRKDNMLQSLLETKARLKLNSAPSVSGNTVSFPNLIPSPKTFSSSPTVDERQGNVLDSDQFLSVLKELVSYQQKTPERSLKLFLRNFNNADDQLKENVRLQITSLFKDMRSSFEGMIGDERQREAYRCKTLDVCSSDEQQLELENHYFQERKAALNLLVDVTKENDEQIWKALLITRLLHDSLT